MSKKILIIDGELSKSHVASYTKTDGTFVKEHDDNRAAAKPDSKMVDHFSAAGHRHISGEEFDAIRQKHAETAKKNKHGNFANANHSGLLDENYRAVGATDSAGSKNSAYVTSQTYSHASHDLPAVTSVYNRKTGERHHFVKDKPAAAAPAKKVMVEKTLAKAHISAFTRKDGTFVKEHEDGRTAAAPAMAKPRAAYGAEHDDKRQAAEVNANVTHHGYSWGRLTKVEGHHRNAIRATLHPEHQEAIGKLADGESHSFSDETKTKWKATRNGDHVTLATSGSAGKANHTVRRSDIAPAVKSKNEGNGFHGEASNAHLRKKYGPDDYYDKASQSDNKEAAEHASRHFADAAHKLVEGGHFESHDKAGEYLDSRHGRHLHDAASAHGGDVSKVPWLSKDVARFKKIGGKPF